MKLISARIKLSPVIEQVVFIKIPLPVISFILLALHDKRMSILLLIAAILVKKALKCQTKGKAEGQCCKVYV